jgi:hypothetical protein
MLDSFSLHIRLLLLLLVCGPSQGLRFSVRWKHPPRAIYPSESRPLAITGYLPCRSNLLKESAMHYTISSQKSARRS